jgi:hypothetical protein
VARHPDIVPDQHHDRDREDSGVEQFLAYALEGVGDGVDESADQAGAHDADRDARPDIAAASRDAARHRHRDADNDAGLDDFAEDDDQCAEHAILALNQKDRSNDCGRRRLSAIRDGWRSSRRAHRERMSENGYCQVNSTSLE